MMLAPSLVAAFLSTAVSAQEPAADPQRVLFAVPEDAFLLVSVLDLDDLRARWQENAWGRLVSADGLSPLRGSLSEAVEDGLDEIDDELEPLALLDAVHGSLALFQAAGERPEDPFRLGFLIEPGEPRADFDALLAAALERATLRGSAPESFERDGLQLRILRVADDEELEIEEIEETDGDEEPEDAPLPAHGGSLLAIGERDGLVACVLGDEREVVAGEVVAALGRWHAREGGLRSSTRLDRARAAHPTAGAAEAFVDVGGLLARGSEFEQLRETLDGARMLGIEWVHGTLAVGQGESLDLSIAWETAADTFWEPVLAGMRPLPMDLLQRTPPSAPTVGAGSFDLTAALAALRELLARTDPDRLTELEDGLDEASLALGGLDVEDDVLAVLGTSFVSMTIEVPREEWREVNGALADENEEMAELLDSLPALGEAYVLELRDAERFEGLLAQLIEVGGLSAFVAEEDLDGQAISHLSVGSEFDLRWVVREGHAAFSQYPSALRAVLVQLDAAGQPSALEDPKLGAALREHRSASFLSVGRTALTLEIGLVGISAFSAWTGLGGAELDSLPSPDELRERFQGTMTSGMAKNGRVVRIFLATR